WPTRESERERLVAEVGECCRGADPLCAAGCLVEAALRQRLVGMGEEGGGDGMTDEHNGVLGLVRHSGLNAIAEECRRLAVARGKYADGRAVQTGWLQVYMELDEWLQAAKFEGKRDEAERLEYGDMVHTVLGLGAHMGYDVEKELRDALRRNR